MNLRKMAVGIFLAFSPIMCLASSYNTVSISPTATMIIPANRGRAGWILCNVSTSTIYIGADSNITTATAMPLLTNEKILADGTYSWNKAIYGIVPAGANMELRFMEWGLAEVSQ